MKVEKSNYWRTINFSEENKNIIVGLRLEVTIFCCIRSSDT